MQEDENDDPVGCPPAKDPLFEFRRIAEAHNLIRTSDPMDENLTQAFYALVERCACVAEPFDSSDDTGSASEAIRAELGQD